MNFAFIGTREPRPEQLAWMHDQLERLRSAGAAVLHTGAALGTDQAAAEAWLGLGGQVVLHLPWPSYEDTWVRQQSQAHRGRVQVHRDAGTQGPEVRELVAGHHPKWLSMKPGVQKLHLRNYAILRDCTQVFAMPGEKPWGGGTGMGIKLALHLGLELQLHDPVSGREWVECGCANRWMRKQRPISVIDGEIDAAQTKLAQLYLERRGRATRDEDAQVRGAMYWCGACGQQRVSPFNGEDTCWDCRQRL